MENASEAETLGERRLSDEHVQRRLDSVEVPALRRQAFDCWDLSLSDKRGTLKAAIHFRFCRMKTTIAPTARM
jgi:hypothetical protein